MTHSNSVLEKSPVASIDRIDGLFERPLVALLDDVLAATATPSHSGDAAIDVARVSR